MVLLVQVSLQCAPETSLVHVSEPNTCHYAMTLTSPLVCHPDAMLVYPTLSDDHQFIWDTIEGRRANGELTMQGYERALRQQVFEVAGLMVSEEEWQRRLTPPPQANVDPPSEGPANFTSVDVCSREYDRLLRQLQTLRTLLDNNGVAYDNQQSTQHPAPNVTRQHVTTNGTSQQPRPHV